MINYRRIPTSKKIVKIKLCCRNQARYRLYVSLRLLNGSRKYTIVIYRKKTYLCRATVVDSCRRANSRPCEPARPIAVSSAPAPARRSAT